MKKTKLILSIIGLTIILALLCPTFASAENDQKNAADLSRHIQIEQSGHVKARTELIDDNLTETIQYAPFETIRLS